MIETLNRFIQQLGSMFKWWVVVYPWELSLRIRWGKTTTELGPGVHWKVPVMHSVFKQGSRLLVSDAPRQTLTTTDGKNLTVSMIVGYRIVNMQQLYLSVQDVENTVLNVIMGEVSRFVSNATLAECTAVNIEEATLCALSSDWGLKYEYVRVNDLTTGRVFRLLGENSRAMWAGVKNMNHAEGDNS